MKTYRQLNNSIGDIFEVQFWAGYFYDRTDNYDIADKIIENLKSEIEEIQLPTEEEIKKVIEDTEYQMFIEMDEVIAGHLKYKYVAKAVHNFLLSKLK